MFNTDPYPGFSWSISQHIGPAARQMEMYAMLEAAVTYSGDPNVGQRITDALVNRGLLTENIREGRAQAWRDYQQVLSQLGIIRSTRYTGNDIEVLPIGLMWLDGSIGYSELVTTQCLRYQYPNGHNLQISTALKEELESNGLTVPPTRTQLDAEHGILVKPAVLILRVLLAILKDGKLKPALTPEECMVLLVPIRRNDQWRNAVAEFYELKRNSIPRQRTRELRHVQEWFRLLSYSDLFVLSNGSLTLSGLAIETQDILTLLCEFHESVNNYWIPPIASMNEINYSWSNYFGFPDVKSQWTLGDADRNQDYINANYPGGLEALEEDEALQLIGSDYSINLRDITMTVNEIRNRDYEVDLGRILSGQAQRQTNTRLHEQLVRQAAEKLEQKGFNVKEDPRSVDILATRDNQEVIIEVKTVTPRSMNSRIRLGVGQLLEYKYRRQAMEHTEPATMLLISADYKFPDWYLQYFESGIQTGLVSRTSRETFVAHTNGAFESLLCS